MLETSLVFDYEGKTIGWDEPEGRNSGWLPDSDHLWDDLLWPNRKGRLCGHAHTHSSDSILGFSSRDLRSFAAIEKGLGRRLVWVVVTPTQAIAACYNEKKGLYEGAPLPVIKELDELRCRSEM